MSALIDAVVGPRTIHVLIVGVAGYDGAVGHTAPNELIGLVRTVDRVAGFWTGLGPFLAGRTLGSVELLLSPGSQSTVTVDVNGEAVQPATFANVRDAFGRWRGRCEKSPDSLAILHWLGHGSMEVAPRRFESSAIALFCQDLDLTGSPVRRAVSLSETMHSIKHLPFAADALCFVDACRAQPGDTEMRTYESAISTSPEKDELPSRITCFNLAYNDTKAFCHSKRNNDCGFQGGSVITEAVLDAFEHYAWSINGTKYPVYAHDLREAVNRRLQWWEPYLGLPKDVEIAASAHSGIMISTQQAPKAMVQLDVKPVRPCPSSVTLIQSDPDDCAHEAEPVEAAGTPMVGLGRSFRAEVPVGGWCAVSQPSTRKHLPHPHVHAFDRYFRDRNWRP